MFLQVYPGLYYATMVPVKPSETPIVVYAKKDTPVPTVKKR